MTVPAPAAYIRLTDPAVEDLRRLARHNPQALRWALQKMLLLEQDPHAGEPLLGGLVGWRKLTVGDRSWRIVWRPTTDAGTTPVIDVAEVWAVGARSDGEVYDEMAARVAALPPNPTTAPLAEVIGRLAAVAGGLTAATPPSSDELPGWLVDRLVHTAGLRRDTVEGMSLEEAVDAWTAWTIEPR